MGDVHTADDLPRALAGSPDERSGEAVAWRSLAMRANQAAKLAGIGRLAVGIIHEINNPVASILPNLHVLLEAVSRLTLPARGRGGGADGESNALLDEIRQISEELVASVDLLTSISRNLKSLAYSAREEPKETDLHECIEAALRVAGHELKHRVRVEKDYDGAVPKLVAYPGLLIQVFLNLFVNAAHAIDGEGTLRIRTRSDGPCVLIEVGDTGRGIPPGDLQRIFRPFFTTKATDRGLGLGLSICKDIINRHGGDIRALSRRSRGTVFQIRMPRDGDSRTMAAAPSLGSSS